MNEQLAFVIIKPDAFGRLIVGEILSRIERTGLRIVGIQERRKTEAWAREHYAHMKGFEFFESMVAFMSTASVLGLNVLGDDAIPKLRLLSGPTVNPSPGSIRFDYGARSFYNLIHVSDTPEAADRERALFYAVDSTVLAVPSEDS